MSYPITPLPKADWQGAILPIGYTTWEYYDVAMQREYDGFSISIQKRQLESPITHTPQEHDFPDRLFAEHWPQAQAWGIVEAGQLKAAIEICPEDWSNRLRVTGWTPACKNRASGIR